MDLNFSMIPSVNRGIGMGLTSRALGVFAALAALLTAGAAQAADLPAPITKAAAVPLHDWTGFYVGGHLGGGLSGDWNGTTRQEPVSPVAQWDLSFGQSASGFSGGAQLGANWHIAPRLVLGIEADLSWANLHGEARISPVPTTGGTAAGTFALMRRDVDWIGTLRGRVGHAWDRWLVFASGGFAFGQVSFAGDVNFTALGGAAFPVSQRKTQLGWTVGGGIEHALPGNWTVRGEYLYYALGAADVNALPVPFTAGTTSHYRWNETAIHALRFGLNYKLGAPLIAKY
jgi:outer membrane immunogenic protein